MSGLTSQPNFNSLVAALEGSEREIQSILKKLNEYSNYFEVVREYYYPFESELKAGTAEVYDQRNSRRTIFKFITTSKRFRLRR